MILTGVFTGIYFTGEKKPYKTVSSIWLSLLLVPKGDLNPHEHCPLPPQDSVSTNSTTSAKKLLSTQYQIQAMTAHLRCCSLLQAHPLRSANPMLTDASGFEPVSQCPDRLLVACSR